MAGLERHNDPERVAARFGANDKNDLNAMSTLHRETPSQSL